MKLRTICTLLISVSLLSACLIVHLVFSRFAFTADLASKSIHDESSGNSDLISKKLVKVIRIDTELVELPIKPSHNVSRGSVQEKKGKEGLEKKKSSHAYPMILLSSNRSVKSDVRGNLGPPSVITSESISNWLTDRWQGETMYKFSRQAILKRLMSKEYRYHTK